MKVHLISTGLELVVGDTINTNSAYLGHCFKKYGIEVKKITTVSDNIDDIVLAIKEEGYDLIFINGGLGPTDDDLTVLSISKALNLKYKISEEKSEKLVRRLGNKYIETMENPFKVCEVLEGALVSSTEIGTASGQIIEDFSKVYFLSPGPPFELARLMDTFFIPYLEDKFKIKKVKDGFSVKVFDIGESAAMQKLANNKSIWDFIEIAPTIKNGYLNLSIKINRYNNKVDLEDIIYKLKEELKNIFGYENIIFSEEPLNEILIAYLKREKLVITTAESCTGGLLSNLITDIPGSSECFYQTFVTYSNESKMENLNVDEKILLKYGAVSRETVIEMVEGLSKKGDSNLQIAISGVAGPDSDSRDNPVGLVHFGLGFNGEIKTYFRNFNGNRSVIKNSSVNYIMGKAIIEIRK